MTHDISELKKQVTKVESKKRLVTSPIYEIIVGTSPLMGSKLGYDHSLLIHTRLQRHTEKGVIRAHAPISIAYIFQTKPSGSWV